MPTQPKAKTKVTPAKPKRAMPKFTPAPEWIKEMFAELLTHFPQAEPKRMFGYPSAFVKGNMACCVFGDRIMLRLSEADRTKFLKQAGSKLFEPMAGRPMKEYVEVTDDLIKAPAELRKWVKKSFAYAESLPPPKKKGK